MRNALLWPLHSLRHLAFTVVVVLGLGWLLFHGHGTHPQARPAAHPSPAVHTTVVPVQHAAAAKPTPTRPAVGPVLHPHTLSVPDDQAHAAVAFIRAWGSHKAPMAWLHGLAPLVTSEELDIMSGVDPARVEATRVTGTIRADVVGPSGSQLHVPTNGGPIELSLVRQHGHVLVEAVEPG